jgi:hypothetical protein
MKRFTLFACLMVLAWTVVAFGADTQQRYNLADGRYSAVLNGQPVWTGAAKQDSVCMLGSKGPYAQYFGNFEDGVGAPSWDRWYGIDLTQKTSPIWHIDTYNANTTPCLDPLTTPNHSWWCGDDYPSCVPGDPVGGYGNSYEEYLAWWGEVKAPFNPNLNVDVAVTGMLSYDNEPGYDYLYLQYEDAINGWTDYATPGVYNGKGICVPVAETQSILPMNRTGFSGKWVHLRWRATSDGAWSDEDCDWPTEGHSQVDLLEVYFTQGATGPAQQGTTETCEPGDTPEWVVEYPTGVGDYALVWALLQEIDPCCINTTPQVASIAHPATGLPTYSCTTWCYGPGGYIVHPEGGAAGPDFHMNNEIWSPIMVWPAGNYDGATYEFTVYRHETLTAGPSPGMFYVWHVRSTTDDNGGMWPNAPGLPPYDVNDASQDPNWPDQVEATWSGWADRNFVYYGGPDCLRVVNEVSDLLLPGRKYVQAAVGTYELGWVWGYVGTDGTPAPYFDDVRVCATEYPGPAISTREIDIFQDNFPAIGTIDYQNACKNSIRFDMARNIALPTDPVCNVPGDTAVFDIVAVRTGTSLVFPPVMMYKLKPNPIFDACRTSGMPNEGPSPGMYTYNNVGVLIADRYNFDLPDSNFFMPGDVIHYYIKACDTGGGCTTLPGDTTGFAYFPGDPGYVLMQYPSSYIVRGLPSLKTLEEGNHPPKLWWNDFANRGLENEWYHAFRCIGYTEGFEFDTYYTNGPSSGVGDGLGGRATATQLTGYDMILYSSGDLSAYTICNADCNNDPGDDLGVLDNWLLQGEKCLFLTGNDLIYDLNTPGNAPGLAFENTWIQVAFNADDVRPLTAYSDAVGASPYPPANPIFFNACKWGVYSTCNPIMRFPDAITTEGNALRIAEWLGPSPNCAFGVYPFAAGVVTPDPALANPLGTYVITLPYDLGWIIEDTRCGGNVDCPVNNCHVRADVLRDVITFCNNPTSSVIIGTPELKVFSASAYPSPFNPKATIEYSIQQPGRMTIQVYDIRGQLVRTLLDGHVAEAGSITWWGDDDSGSSVASGVYMIKVADQFGNQKMIKTALVK